MNFSRRRPKSEFLFSILKIFDEYVRSVTCTYMPGGSTEEGAGRSGTVKCILTAVAESTMKEEPSRTCICATKPCTCSQIATAPFCYPQSWNENFAKAWPALLAQQPEFFYTYALKPVEPANIVTSSNMGTYRSPRPRRKKNAVALPASAPISPPSSNSSLEQTTTSNNNNTIDLNKNDTGGSTTSSGGAGALVGGDIVTRSKAVNNKNKAPRKFKCELCQKSFDYKHVLMNHQRTHTGEKPYKCNICDKAFTRDHHLKTHTRLHTGEKPFKCTVCGKEFVQVANLRRHDRVHTGERPYACDVDGCLLKFSDSNQLKAHRMTHTKERPYSCATCDQRYRRKHHLRDHKCKRTRCGGDDGNGLRLVNGATNLEEHEEMEPENSSRSSVCSGSLHYEEDGDDNDDQFPLDLSVGKKFAPSNTR